MICADLEPQDANDLTGSPNSLQARNKVLQQVVPQVELSARTRPAASADCNNLYRQGRDLLDTAILAQTAAA